MSNTTMVWEIYTGPVAGIHPNSGWLDSSKQSLTCAICGSLIRRDKGLAVEIESPLHKFAYTVVWGLSLVNVASVKFIDALGQIHVANNFLLGDVILANEGVLGSHLSLLPKRTITIRGNKESTYRRCKECGSILYDQKGSPYVLSGDLPPDPIFVSDLSTILVKENYFSSLNFSGLKKYLKFCKVAVRETPVDGHPVAL